MNIDEAHSCDKRERERERERDRSGILRTGLLLLYFLLCRVSRGASDWKLTATRPFSFTFIWDKVDETKDEIDLLLTSCAEFFERSRVELAGFLLRKTFTNNFIYEGNLIFRELSRD